MDTPAPTREWRRKRYRRSRRDWMTLTGLALLAVMTAVVVAAAFAR
ncbi:hypothetical protein AAE021_10570 [Arthrobacter citreus]|uniref:ABC transporter permease n=1 Tax=Arthrobacter citreus TaxID=1670 RepID=A0ABZ2ZR67_9MICC